MIDTAEKSSEESYIEQLGRLSEIVQGSKTPFWAWLKAIMEAAVDEAHYDMAGNLSSDPMVSFRLQLRWQQRQAMQLLLVGRVKECQDELKRITEEMNKPDEHTGYPAA